MIFSPQTFNEDLLYTEYSVGTEHSVISVPPH